MGFEKAIEDLYSMIEDIQHTSKKFTRTKMVSNNIPISTISKFYQSQRKDGFNFTVTTLHKIAKRIDFLNKKEGKPTTYAKTFEKMINSFIKKYILVEKKSNLVKKYNLNHYSLNRMIKFNIRNTAISMNTLVEYAKAVQYNQPLKDR